jgi:hypothetical protein
MDVFMKVDSKEEKKKEKGNSILIKACFKVILKIISLKVKELWY